MRVFITVGAQMPFDRLVEAVDRWAAERPEHQVRAQIGASALRPGHLDWSAFLDPEDFEAECARADAIVGHAGIGTLFSAMKHGKAVLVLPREAARRETRNDHQTATAKRFAAYDGVEIAWSADEVGPKLDGLAGRTVNAQIGAVAGGPLIDALRAFIDRGRL
ncbi:MAG: glycosyltransferase [Sandaracinaceae bacterium]